MPKRRPASKAALAAETWRRLFAFFVGTSGHRTRVLEHFQLTPNDARAIQSLDATRGRTMRSLADAWGCDASNATWIIDRLEERGLAERRAMASDRRVKLVVLTPAGAAMQSELIARISEPPPELLALDRADLEALNDAAAKLPSITPSAL
jgi:DNA-binding MarR family transcriptional regulator